MRPGFQAPLLQHRPVAWSWRNCGSRHLRHAPYPSIAVRSLPHSSRSAYADLHGLTSTSRWIFHLMSMIDAEILRDQGFVLLKLAGSARKNAAPGIEDDRGIGDLQRKLEILLDHRPRRGSWLLAWFVR